MHVEMMQLDIAWESQEIWYSMWISSIGRSNFFLSLSHEMDRFTLWLFVLWLKSDLPE